MFRPRFARCLRRAFTLIELLVVISIIGILVALAFPVFNQVMIKAHQLTTLSNMRQVGLAFVSYAGDNSYQLPTRAVGTNPRWPAVLAPYVQNLQVYNAPIPGYVGTVYQVTDPVKLQSNTMNNTDYIANGYNDLGALNDPTIAPRLNLIASPGQVVLLGIPYPGKNNYYMDFSEGGGNNNDILNKTPWPTGSIYVFSDGSSRFLKYRQTDNMKVAPVTSDYYSDWLWLVDKGQTVVIQ